MKKRIFATLLAGAMVFGLAACGSTPAATPAPTTAPAAANTNTAANTPTDNTATGATVNLKVWGSQDDQDMLQGMVDSFKAANPGTNYNITLGVVGEDTAATTYLQDPSTAADVFSFANDQLATLVNAGALYQITGDYLSQVQSDDTADSVAAATANGNVYAFPSTADNGYFMYYDKSVFSDTDVQTLDGMVAKAKAAGKTIMYDLSNGWYLAGFFIGAGCNVTIDGSGNATCDWNNQAGQDAAAAIRAFANSGAWCPPGSSGDDTLVAGIGTTIAAGVSGTWNADKVKAALGDNYAACKLPTFTSGGKQVQMGSYSGYKFVGVSSATQAPADALKLAQWITNEQNQVIRLQTRGFGPSNKTAIQDPAVSANPALVALAAQMPFAVVQNNVPGSFWTPAGALGTALTDATNTTDVKTLLDQAVTAITTPAS